MRMSVGALRRVIREELATLETVGGTDGIAVFGTESIDSDEDLVEDEVIDTGRAGSGSGFERYGRDIGTFGMQNYPRNVSQILPPTGRTARALQQLPPFWIDDPDFDIFDLLFP